MLCCKYCWGLPIILLCAYLKAGDTGPILTGNSSAHLPWFPEKHQNLYHLCQHLTVYLQKLPHKCNSLQKKGVNKHQLEKQKL